MEGEEFNRWLAHPGFSPHICFLKIRPEHACSYGVAPDSIRAAFLTSLRAGKPEIFSFTFLLDKIQE
jgi:hypothetical protein